MLRTGFFFYIRPMFANHSCRLGTIQITPVCFFFRHFNINASQSIDYFYKCVKIDTDIILNIKIKVTVQKTDCLFRTACIICCVRFIVASILLLQQRIPVYRHKLHVTCLIIDTCDHNTVTLHTAVQFIISRIQSKQCNVRILSCILIDFQLFFIQHIIIQFSEFEYSVSSH